MTGAAILVFSHAAAEWYRDGATTDLAQIVAAKVSVLSALIQA